MFDYVEAVDYVHGAPWRTGHRHGYGAATAVCVRRCKITRQMSPPLCRVDGRCLSLRLADGALSADIFPRDYHCLAAAAAAVEAGGVQNDDHRVVATGGPLLPVKWMAVEHLQQPTNDDRHLSPAGDVVRISKLETTHVYFIHSNNVLSFNALSCC